MRRKKSGAGNKQPDDTCVMRFVGSADFISLGTWLDLFSFFDVVTTILWVCMNSVIPCLALRLCFLYYFSSNS